MSIDAVLFFSPFHLFFGTKGQIMVTLLGMKKGVVHLALTIGLLLKIVRTKKKQIFSISEREQNRLQYCLDECQESKG